MIAVLCFGCLFVTINQPLPASSHVCTSYTHQIITANSHLTHLHVLSLTKTRLGNRSFVLASPWLWNNVSSFVAFGERLYVLAGVCCKHICLTEATAHSDIFAFRCCVQIFLLTYLPLWMGMCCSDGKVSSRECAMFSLQATKSTQQSTDGT